MEREADVVHASADAGAGWFPLKPDELSVANGTGAFAPEVFAPHVLDIPRSGCFRVRRSQVNVVIIGCVDTSWQSSYDSDDDAQRSEFRLHDFPLMDNAAADEQKRKTLCYFERLAPPRKRTDRRSERTA